MGSQHPSGFSSQKSNSTTLVTPPTGSPTPFLVHQHFHAPSTINIPVLTLSQPGSYHIDVNYQTEGRHGHGNRPSHTFDAPFKYSDGKNASASSSKKK